MNKSSNSGKTGGATPRSGNGGGANKSGGGGSSNNNGGKNGGNWPSKNPGMPSGGDRGNAPPAKQ